MKARIVRILAAVLVSGSMATADVSLTVFFGSGMVIQRNRPIPVFGTADAGESVRVNFAGQTAQTTADADGKWRVEFKPVAGPGPFEMVVSGRNELKLEDVLVGDVWVCSGQSNMEWPMSRLPNYADEVSAGGPENVRLFRIPKTRSVELADTVAAQWTKADPESLNQFSSVGYWFGKTIHGETGVPIGLIQSAWGGTHAEAWVPMPILTDWAAKQGVTIQDNIMAGELYAAMIHPITVMPVRGVIWYQGESNAGKADVYASLMATLVESWRSAWRDPEMPFYVVQLANFRAPSDDPNAPAGWADVREAQRLMAATVPHTGLATAIDIGEEKDIHPKEKREVGRRLALLALRDVYGKDVVASGPTVKSVQTLGDSLVVTFDNVAGGLKAKEGTLDKNFVIAGEDGDWHWADATIVGDTVVLKAAGVAKPTRVRFGWRDNPAINLYNSENLPAIPFEASSAGVGNDSHGH